jgi:tripartite-type tricarboxylate transporter receptor subunit TctC
MKERIMKQSRTKVAHFGTALGFGLALVAIPALAGEYPSRTIKIVISQPPGGLMDMLPRVFGQKITESTRQAVVVESRLGGNGAVAGAEVARARPDGYTLTIGFHGLNAMLPHMTGKLSFDPNQAFAPVIHVLTIPSVLVVNPAVPAQSLKELIALAKAKPGQLTFASQGVGSSGHVAGELFKRLAGINIVHVPYRGAAPAQQAVIAGDVTMLFDTVSAAIEPVKAGKMRALGVAAAAPVDAIKDVPTMAQAGLPLEMDAWFGLMAPAGTSPEVIAWLNHEAARIFSTPAIRDLYVSQGASLPLGTPEAFGTYIADEFRKWGPVIREANIQID